MTTSKKSKDVGVNVNFLEEKIVKTKEGVEFISGEDIIGFTNYLMDTSRILLETVETKLEPISSIIKKQTFDEENLREMQPRLFGDIWCNLNIVDNNLKQIKEIIDTIDVLY